MTKRRCPMSVHGVIKAAYDEIGGVEAVAVLLPHRKPGWLHASTNPDLEDRHQVRIAYEDARALTRAGVMTFAHDLAGLCGMTLVPVEAAATSAGELMSKGGALMAESGEAVARIAAAAADGVIDARERQALTSEIIDVLKAAHSVLQLLGGADNRG